MRFAQIQGEQWANVRELVAALRSQGEHRAAQLLLDGAAGEVQSIRKVRP